MPRPTDLSTTKLDARSSIANYLNNISDDRYKAEKKRYKDKEPLSESKSWEEFVRLAISRQYLEERSGNPIAKVYDGEKVLLRTRKREKNFLGFDKREDPKLTRAIANLDQRAREYAKRGSKAHKSESRHSHHERVEENAPSGRSKHGKTAPLSIAAPPPRHSQMPSNNAHGNDHRNGPAPAHEYVYPAAPPIVITSPNGSTEPRRQDYQPSPQRHDYQAPPQRPAQTGSHLSSAGAPSMSGGRRPPAPSPPPGNERDPHRADRLPERRESASRSGYGYSNRPSDIHSQGRASVRQSFRDDYSHERGSVIGSHQEDYAGIEHWRDSSTLTGNQAGRQERRSGVSRESTRSDRSAYSDESWDSEATVGMPDWGSGGAENGVSNRREGRASDGRDDRMSERGNSRGYGRSERGL